MRKGYVFVYFYKITVSLHKYNQNKAEDRIQASFIRSLLK